MILKILLHIHREGQKYHLIVGEDISSKVTLSYRPRGPRRRRIPNSDKGITIYKKKMNAEFRHNAVRGADSL